MVSPELLGLGAVVIVAGMGIAYSYFTGGRFSIDVDDREVSVEGPEGETEVETTIPSGEEIENVLPEAITGKDDLTDVKGIGETRANNLANAGFLTVEDLYRADDDDLFDVKGIGQYTIEQIRSDIGSP